MAGSQQSPGVDQTPMKNEEIVGATAPGSNKVVNEAVSGENYDNTNVEETKEYEEDRKADKVAVIRTFWVLLHIICCLAIILNAIANHGWKLIGL